MAAPPVRCADCDGTGRDEKHADDIAVLERRMRSLAERYAIEMQRCEGRDSIVLDRLWRRWQRTYRRACRSGQPFEFYTTGKAWMQHVGIAPEPTQEQRDAILASIEEYRNAPTNTAGLPVRTS